MRNRISLVLVFLLAASCGTVFAAFDPAVLVDTVWVVQSKGKSIITDSDGKETEVINEGLLLELTEGAFTLSAPDEELFIGTWTADAKGKLTLVIDQDSLEVFLLDELETGEIADSSCSFQGAVKQKGDTLSLQLTLAISGTGQDDYGTARLAFAAKMNGSTIPGPPQVTPAAYVFTDVRYLNKVKNLSYPAAVTIVLSFDPLSDYGGTFTLVGEAGAETLMDLDGFYTVIGKKTVLFSNSDQLEWMCETSIDSLMEANLEEVEDIIDWWLEDSTGAITFQTKGTAVAIAGKISYVVGVYLDNDQERQAKGAISFRGAGTLEP